MTPKYEFLGSDFSHTQTIVQEAVQVVLDVTCVSVGDTQREAKNDQRENSNGTNWQTRTNCSQNANELTQNTNDRREDIPHHSHFIIVSQKKESPFKPSFLHHVVLSRSAVAEGLARQNCSISAFTTRLARRLAFRQDPLSLPQTWR
jgi:hypothetical protein